MKFMCFWFVYFQFSLVIADENIVIDAEENVLKVGQKVSKDPVKNKKEFNIHDHVLVSKETPDGLPYAVYDNLLPAKYKVLLKYYLTSDTDAWLFKNYDDGEDKDQTDNVPWINEQDPFPFSKTKICRRLFRAVKATSKEEGPYYPYRVFGKILRRSDHTKVYQSSLDQGEFTAMVFVNEFWKKNYYGELYLYDNNKEIVGGATHKGGRVVVWDSRIYHLNRPPAVQFAQGQILFQVQFTKNFTKMVEYHERYMDYQEKRQEARKTWFLPDYTYPEGIPSPEKHKTFEFTTKTDGRKILVYDNLFTEDLLNHLRSYVLKYGSYFYDDSIDDVSDNVQWIAGFPLDPYIQSPYWKILQKASTHATGSSIMFPYDISMNLVRSSDHTRIHEDVSYPGEEEFTCLIYLNPQWKATDYGETSFFEKNSDDTEIVAQVRPRYGRLVIFDGNIPHSARPPSFNFTGGRLTFVTKLHKNEFYGRRKNMIEEMRQYKGKLFFMLDELPMLEGKRGEAIARHRLKEEIDMLRHLTQKAHETEEVEEEDESIYTRGNEENKQENKPDQQTWDEGDKRRQHEEEEKIGLAELIVGEYEDRFDEESLKMLQPLSKVTETTTDGLQKLIDVHKDMVVKLEELKEQHNTKMMSIM